jgi:hypothetical protein
MTPAAPGEVLVSSGVYVDFLNGQPTGAREHWTVYTGAAGQITRAERDAFGLIVRVQVTEGGGRLAGFDIELENPSSPTVRHALARYRIEAGRLLVERRVNDKQTIYAEVPLDEDSVVAPLLHVFMGRTVLEIARQGAATPVIVPWLHSPHDGERLLLPEIEMRAAAACDLPPEPVEGDGLTCYQYVAPLGDTPIHLWLHREGRLARTLYHQDTERVWTTMLTDYRTYADAAAPAG